VDVGYVLLGAAGVAAIIGWDLARRGFSQVGTAASASTAAANELRSLVGSTQLALAAETLPAASDLAEANAEAIEKAGALEGAIEQVNSALAGLTGTFAPARVLFAFALLLILASLVALDVVSATIGNGS
jgi:hypothetical protein